MASNEDFIEELSKRYGAKGESSDVARLQEYEQGIAAGTTTPEQLAQHKQALAVQYQQRGSNVPGGGQQSQAPSAPQQTSPAQSWNAAPADPFPTWYKDLMQQQLAQQQATQTENKARADALFGQLSSRAGQGLQVNAADPIIKGQVDAFAAQQERARRNYLSDVAERGGSLANIQGERRMAAERAGQGTAAFQAELLGRELGARRDEIAQALTLQGHLLSADQQRALQAQLATMDQAIKEAGVGLQGRGLDIQRELGVGGLGLQQRGQDINYDEFLRELALRQWDLGNQNDWRWANL